MIDKDFFANMKPCPRCTRMANKQPCPECLRDMAFEQDAGVLIPEDQWPVEHLAAFERAAEQLDV